jgi:hypothetical protein
MAEIQCTLQELQSRLVAAGRKPSGYPASPDGLRRSANLLFFRETVFPWQGLAEGLLPTHQLPIGPVPQLVERLGVNILTEEVTGTIR